MIHTYKDLKAERKLRKYQAIGDTSLNNYYINIDERILYEYMLCYMT